MSKEEYQPQPSKPTEQTNPPPESSLTSALARARRLAWRQEFQTRLPDRRRPVEDPSVHEAEFIVFSKEYKDRREQEGAHLTPQEREDRRVREEIDYLKESRTMTMKINYAQHLEPEVLDRMQRFDPEFMAPIFEGLKKRPARKAKAESAIQRRGISPGIDDYAPLWER